MATQALVKGHRDNARDRILQRVGDPAALETLMVEYHPLPGSTIGELTANFDIVLGQTPEEREDGTLGGIGEPPRA